MGALLALLLTSAFAATAQGMGHHRWAKDRDAQILATAYHDVYNEIKDKPIGSLTAAEIAQAAQQLSIARQQYAYIKRSEMESFIVPGLGQFRDGAPLQGSLFLASDLAVVAGTLAGAYFLLPSDLQFSSINYFTTPISTIRTAWEGHTLLDYLPSMGVAAGGMILNHLLRFAAAANAGDLARANVRDKKVTFQPEPLAIMPAADGRLGVGFGMRMAW